MTTAGLVAALWTAAGPAAAGVQAPVAVHVEPATGHLLVLGERSGTIARVDPGTGRIVAEAPVGESPCMLAAGPDGRRLYVSCRDGQQVVELDAPSLETLRRFELRGDPTGVAVSADGRRLYAGVHSLDQVAVFDLESGTELRRLVAGDGPQMLARSPVGTGLYVTNLLSGPVPPGEPSRNEVTVIDGGRGRVVDRIVLENANVGRHIAFTSDGAMAIAAISRPRNLVPMVQVARGWVVTNGFAVISTDGRHPPVQLLVDLPNRAFADPHAVAMMPDDSRFYLSAAGSDMVLAVDLEAVRAVMEEALAGRIPRYADHLGLSRRYVTARIPVGANPHALALDAAGAALYVANRLDDSITVIDTATNDVVRTIALGDPAPTDPHRVGERLFHSAARTFQQQFTCASCHPDRGLDGLRYDLEPDDLGRDILDNRSMRAIAGTAPFKWVGTNPDITTQCGTRTAKWIVRTGWLDSSEVVALAEYIRSIPAVHNPYLADDGRLTAAQRRGRELFERTTTNDGRPIAERDRCDFCHAGPHTTNFQAFDVGTAGPTDTKRVFDTAHLTNIFESPPYLHDGRAATLEEIWTRHNPDDRHGISSDWTKQQLNDLVEYLKAIAGPEQTP
jgi:YVTN family beta-propeller protein